MTRRRALNTLARAAARARQCRARTRTMVAVTAELARHVARTRAGDLPAAVRRRAAELVLDLWGVAIRARHDAESTPCFMATLEQLGQAGGGCGVAGDDRSWTPWGAALLNGALAHSLDFDDTHAEGSIHPGAAVIPAAFAAAELAGAGGAAVVAGVTAGYDVTCRLSMALGPSAHYGRGFHPSATCGAFGAAAAASRVLGLDETATASAFGLTGSLAAGSLQFLANGAWNKRWQVGAAAANGLSAAIAVRNGFVGAAEPLEGERGFLAGYSPAPDPARAVELLGRRYDLIETGIKPYPACRYTHAALDAIRGLMAEHGLTAADIRSVAIGLPRTGIAITGEPEADKRRPASVVDGQFSMHFVAAVTIATGTLTWDDYGRHLGSPTVLALCDRISVGHEPRAEAVYPRRMAGSARLETTRGPFERFVEIPSGEPENFPDEAGHLAKFHGLVDPYLGAGRAAELAAGILGLERASSVAPLFALSRPVAGSRAAAE